MGIECVPPSTRVPVNLEAFTNRKAVTLGNAVWLGT